MGEVWVMLHEPLEHMQLREVTRPAASSNPYKKFDRRGPGRSLI